MEPIAYLKGEGQNPQPVDPDHPLPVDAEVSVSIPDVQVDAGEKDIFGHLTTASRYNQIEVTFDDDPANVEQVTVSAPGSATTGYDQTVATITSSPSNPVTVESVVKSTYRPFAQWGWGATLAFESGVAGHGQRAGMFNDDAGLWVGFDGTDFGVAQRSGGGDTHRAVGDWNVDGWEDLFTLDGVPVTFDPLKGNLYYARIGYFGFAGWELLLWSPDFGFIPVHREKWANRYTQALFQAQQLPMRAQIDDGATKTIRTTCWAAGTTSTLQRMVDTITDETLAETVRSVIFAKDPSGDYVPVRSNSQGRFQVAAEIDTWAVTDTDVEVADDYDTEDHAADQAGADAVLDFTVAAGSMVMVDVDPVVATDFDNYRCRATTDGTTPSITTGFVCRPGTTYLPIVSAGTVKVYAPTGVTVAVQSLARS